MTLLHAPPGVRNEQKYDGGFEFIAKMEEMKKLCEDYQRKLQESEETAAMWEKRAQQDRKQVMALKMKAQGLQAQAMEFEEETKRAIGEAAQSQRARVMAEERMRRQEEILKETRRLEGLVSTENKQLVVKLAKVQKWTECIDDDEVRRIMRQLYQDLEDWIKRHFPCLLPIRSAGNASHISEDYQVSRLHTLHGIHAEVYSLVFHCILWRFFVGFWDIYSNNQFRQIDHEISPDHIWHHWRSATSNAVFSLASSELKSTCDHIVEVVEEKFGSRSVSDRMARMEELQQLVWRFVEFKHKLERQNEQYFFWWLIPNTAFNEDHMETVTVEIPANGVISFPISPVLSKSRPLQNESTIVQKSYVKLMTMPPVNEDHAGTEEEL
ncbi:hypothetical protein N7492_002292 [Penicillium capsulatum]|uniref:Uncharacterized protein n=1 Tax=Penicillium capsulatum TaxID=69766 RepID=A0A9W9IJV1_9EURO|nr:hypothetical protein N7492_002292 [Penicillium capsulatum]